MQKSKLLTVLDTFQLNVRYISIFIAYQARTFLYRVGSLLIYIHYYHYYIACFCLNVLVAYSMNAYCYLCKISCSFYSFSYAVIIT